MLLKEQSSVLLKVRYSHIGFTDDILMLDNVDVILLTKQSYRFNERINFS